MIRRALIALTSAVALGAAGAVVLAQMGRPASPAGTSATQVGGKYEKPAGADEPVYTGGKWIEISYGRPIRRGRDLWGSGAEYGKTLNAGAPVWRAGANVTTRLKTEVPLVINSKTVAPGEYSVFIDLKPNNWTLIVSSYGVANTEREANANTLWGSYNYTPAKDVVRAPMKLETPIHSFDQLTWAFQDVTDQGGIIAIIWDKVTASVAFRIGSP
jgi:DUF2911 family protein